MTCLLLEVPRFFVDLPLAVGQRLALPAEAARHAAQARRLKAGAKVSLFNGKGGEYHGKLVKCDRQGAEAELANWLPDDRAPQHRAHLGLCVLKREAMTAALARATELGVARITPLVSSHVTVAAKAIGERLPRWRKAVISSCEQCGLNRLPVVDEPRPLADWLAEPREGARIAAMPEVAVARPQPVKGDFTLAIGPEGGFSEAESQQALAAGFTPISLGPRLLRSETAPLAALAILMPF